MFEVEYHCLHKPGFVNRHTFTIPIGLRSQTVRKEVDWFVCQTIHRTVQTVRWNGRLRVQMIGTDKDSGDLVRGYIYASAPS